ncbi:MAG TPA: GNAT family N-acetyltransferase [Hyphomonadaceae bacterium]|nr:GNAT family N-acetyltransferase [Hyphomonadaceae bacterium]
MTVTLRLAAIADIPRMQQIEQDAATLFAGLDLIDITEMATASIGDHCHAIDEGLSLVAEVDGRIAGFVIGNRYGADVYLHELDVGRDYQQKGVGAALVRGFIDVAQKQGAPWIYLSTFRAPPWNAPFYRKLGFADVPRTDYLPWMAEIEHRQAEFLDITTRVFMKLAL